MLSRLGTSIIITRGSPYKQPLRYRGESHVQIQSFCRVYLFTNKGH